MTNRLYGLDVLRLLMALSVLFYHFGFRGPAHGDMPALDLPLWLSEASKYGYLGVSVFFMISGFVIAYSAEGRTASEFAIARFSRIYPTFIVCMTVTFFVESWAGTPQISASFADYLANFVLVSRALGFPFMDGAYWSIVLEVIFYGWVFALLLTGLFQSHKLPILGIWLAASFLNAAVLHLGVLDALLITKYSGFFMAGIAIYELRKKSTAAMWAVLGLAMTLALYTSYQAMLGLEDEFHIVFSLWVLTAIVLLAPLVFYAFLSFRIPDHSIWLATLAGGVSFPLYLVHQHIGYVIFYHLGGGNARTLTFVMIDLFMLALMIYVFFDRHMVVSVRATLTRWFGPLSSNNIEGSYNKTTALTPGE